MGTIVLSRSKKKTKIEIDVKIKKKKKENKVCTIIYLQAGDVANKYNEMRLARCDYRSSVHFLVELNKTNVQLKSEFDFYK